MERDKSKSEEEIQSTESLHEHHCFIAAQGQSPLRVDKFLMTRIENATRSKIQQAAKSGSIFIGENAVKSNYKVKGGDHIRVLFSHPPYQNILIPEYLPLNIVYEDEKSLVFKDINPIAPTHLLIIPKKQIEKISDASEDDELLLGHLFLVAGKVARQLGVEDAFRLVINNGAGAQQTVFHLHIHLIAEREFSWPPG